MQVITFTEEVIIQDDFVETIVRDSLNGVIGTTILHYTDEIIGYKQQIKELEQYKKLVAYDKQQLVESILVKDKRIEELENQLKQLENTDTPF